MEFAKAITLFGPMLSMLIYEAPINLTNKKSPHGNLDILMVTPSFDSGPTQIEVLITNLEHDKVIITSSIKTEFTLQL